MKDYLNEGNRTHFIFPIDGDYLNKRDGERDELGALITVCASSETSCRVRINGAYATERSGIYYASVHIPMGESVITAVNEDNGDCESITVYYSESYDGKYRISSDDNILFLADITEKKDSYSSIFDNPYLAVYKKAHDLFQAKVHLNLFYEFDSEAATHFSESRPYFNLSMMTDKFKVEWTENSDWLKLSFHARGEFPDKPYNYAEGRTIVSDYLDVRREVLRFAGEECFSEDVTTVHWGEANTECVRALQEYGLRALTGYFELDEGGEPLVSYYAPLPLTLHIGERDFFRDREMGVTFGRIDRVTNIGTLDEIMRDMEYITRHRGRGGFVSFMIHEQYFYPDYENYLSDFDERVLAPARLLFEKGYTGAHVKEVI